MTPPYAIETEGRLVEVVDDKDGWLTFDRTLQLANRDNQEYRLYPISEEESEKLKAQLAEENQD